MKKSLFLFVFLIYAMTSIGQTIKVDAEIRSRAEFRDGFRDPLADTLNASFVNNLRTRINAYYESKDIKSKISILDTRTYGNTDVSKTGEGLGILEAWGEYNFAPEIAFSLGRQGLEYDDKRLFSYNNWSNTLGAHDLLLLKYQSSYITINVGSAYNNAGDSTRFLSPYKQSYKTLNFIWIGKSFGKVSASALWVNDSFERGKLGDIKTSYRNTIGGNLWLTNKKEPFYFIINGYYQFGRDKQNKSLNTYLLSATVRQKLSHIFELKLGTDIFSGSDNDIASDKNHTFTKLYGTNHAFNGSMEYWATLPSQGLFDLHAEVSCKFSAQFDIEAAFHRFSTVKRIDAGNRKNIGSELDITANYTVNSQFTIQGGWSSYFKTKGTDTLKKKTGIDTHFPQWAYLQLTFKPQFFSKE
ncbi:MAG: alginate export family protein [Dysgonomonas sp.]